ncbi:hypothetical protein BDD12DRAFT_914552 [Trichophaea hybrida]|nr:hypothetical protein BDD12DRAFT_914552 [Trichophaea hybrida]
MSDKTVTVPDQANITQQNAARDAINNTQSNNLSNSHNTHHDHSTTGSHNTINSGNTTTTNSNNTTDNSRTYNNSKHNEFKDSTFHGGQTFS